MQHRWVRWSWDVRFCACCGVVEEKLVEKGKRHFGRNHFYQSGYRRGEQTEAIYGPRPDCDNTFVPIRMPGFDIDIMRRGPAKTDPASFSTSKNLMTESE